MHIPTERKHTTSSVSEELSKRYAHLAPSQAAGQPQHTPDIAYRVGGYGAERSIDSGRTQITWRVDSDPPQNFLQFWDQISDLVRSPIYINKFKAWYSDGFASEILILADIARSGKKIDNPMDWFAVATRRVEDPDTGQKRLSEVSQKTINKHRIIRRHALELFTRLRLESVKLAYHAAWKLYGVAPVERLIVQTLTYARNKKRPQPLFWHMAKEALAGRPWTGPPSNATT